MVRGDGGFTEGMLFVIFFDKGDATPPQPPSIRALYVCIYIYIYIYICIQYSVIYTHTLLYMTEVINVLHFCFELRALKMTSRVKHLIAGF